MRNRVQPSETESFVGEVQPAGGGDYWVASLAGDKRYLVTADDGGYQCTCRWARYHDTRTDPCAHVVAVQNAIRPAQSASASLSADRPQCKPQGLDVLNQFENARALRGAATKLSARYGVDIDDVSQEMAIAAMGVIKSYGFCHVNTAVNRTKDALSSGSYGVNRYYTAKGLSEVSIDQESDDGEDEWIANFADGSADWDQVDVRVSIEQAAATLPAVDALIIHGLMADMTRREIADLAGIHETGVSRRKAQLQVALSGVLG